MEPLSVPSVSSSRTRPMLRDNVYKPNTKLLVRTLGDALLSMDPSNRLLDVRLTSTDGHDIPANRTLLAIGSPVFKRMFYSDFAENDAPSVPLSFTARILRQILQFIYTSESDLITAILRRLNSRHLPPSRSRDIPRTDLIALVDLAVAADFLDMDLLQRLTSETLLAVVKSKPYLACFALEAMVSHRPAFKHCAPACLWAEVMQDPAPHLLIPDCRHAIPDKQREAPAGTRGLLELSASTLEYLVTSTLAADRGDTELDVVTPVTVTDNPDDDAWDSEHTCEHCDSESDSDSDVWDAVSTAYFFQALYFWATNGRLIERRPPRTLAFDPTLSAQSGTPQLSAGVYGRRGRSGSSRDEASSAQRATVTEVDGVSINETIRDNGQRDMIVMRPSERWRAAMRIAAMLDLSGIDSSFLSDYAENSGLIDPGTLFGIYRYHATGRKISNDGEQQRAIIDEDEDEIVTLVRRNLSPDLNVLVNRIKL